MHTCCSCCELHQYLLRRDRALLNSNELSRIPQLVRKIAWGPSPRSNESREVRRTCRCLLDYSRPSRHRTCMPRPWNCWLTICSPGRTCSTLARVRVLLMTYEHNSLHDSNSRCSLTASQEAWQRLNDQRVPLEALGVRGCLAPSACPCRGESALNIVSIAWG